MSTLKQRFSLKDVFVLECLSGQIRKGMPSGFDDFSEKAHRTY